MNIYIFGNGNISFNNFKKYYESVITKYAALENTRFLLCDFKGVDVLAMEVLKCTSPNVSVYHIGERPRYLSDKFKTKVSSWKLIGGFENDEQRDAEAIQNCTHYIAIDFNADANRISGTQKNIDHCEKMNKIKLTAE